MGQQKITGPKMGLAKRRDIVYNLSKAGKSGRCGGSGYTG
jgi:hypothetical protein